MKQTGSSVLAGRAFVAVLAAGFLVMLAANLPGHLSYDSVIELTEGRFNQRITWAPAFYSWVLGAFDAIVPGTGLYVVASGLMLMWSLASAAGLRGRVSWLGVAVAAAVVFTPQLMIYQAIAWKDVFFANLAVAGMVCLARAAAAWPTPWRRWAWLSLALAALAAAGLTRQNGLLVGLAACVALGWVASRGAWWRGLAWGAGGLVVLLAATQLIGTYAAPAPVRADDGISEGVRILQTYDILGALALDPAAPLGVVERDNPKAAAVMRIEAPQWYSPERVDYLDDEPTLGAAMAGVSPKTISDQWLQLLGQRPDLYLRHRLQVFRWVFLTPVIDRCLPVFVGVSGPANRLAVLGMTENVDPVDRQMINYSTWFMDTPAYSHLAYALIALAVGIVLLVRRDPADLPMAALMGGALAFAGSFFAISLACDYRYLYFLDLAAMAGLIYLAVDPRLRRRKG